ncbi:hypothetical protein GW915_02195 [bacterium]|nr:hypothetical protein [bacterium]
MNNFLELRKVDIIHPADMRKWQLMTAVIEKQIALQTRQLKLSIEDVLIKGRKIYSQVAKVLSDIFKFFLLVIATFGLRVFCSVVDGLS